MIQDKSKKYNPTKNSHFGHLTDILELSIDLWKGTTLDLVGSCHNDSLPGFRARLSSRNIMHVSVLTSLHEARVNAADRGLVETPHVVTEL